MAPREVALEVELGGLRVVGAGLRSRALAASEVVGASSAPRADGQAGVEVALALGGGQSRPLVLAVATEDGGACVGLSASRRAGWGSCRGACDLCSAGGRRWRARGGWRWRRASPRGPSSSRRGLALAVVPLSVWDRASRVAGAGERADVTLARGEGEARGAGAARSRTSSTRAPRGRGCGYGRAAATCGCGCRARRRWSGRRPRRRSGARRRRPGSARRRRRGTRGWRRSSRGTTRRRARGSSGSTRWRCRRASRAAAYRGTEVDYLDDLWNALECPDAPAPLRAAAARLVARVAPEPGPAPRRGRAGGRARRSHQGAHPRGARRGRRGRRARARPAA